MTNNDNNNNNDNNDIYVIYGDRPKEMAGQIMTAMNIAQKLAEIQKKKGGDEIIIGLKPNLVVAQPADWGATTDPQLVIGAIEYLKAHGFTNLIILEGAWVGDCTEKAFQVCGYETLAAEYGIPLVDLKKDKSTTVEVNGQAVAVCEQALAVDYLINLPVLKAHCQTKITCALKNLKGCIPDKEKRRFHTMGLHGPIALLNKALTSHLTIVDGIIGDLTFEEGGTPVRMNRVIASHDPVLLDTYAAQLLGYDFAQIPYIAMAADLAVGTTQLTDEQIVEINSQREAQVPEPNLASEQVDYLSQWIVEDQACSACYGSAIHALMRLKEKGLLEQLQRKLYVGQGWWNHLGTEQQLGIGRCANKFQQQVAGCPPKATAIVKFLQEQLLEKNNNR